VSGSGSGSGSGRLVVCPTPIGNPGDLTARAADALRAADLVACEDTRRTGALLASLGVKRRLLSVHEHNEGGRIERVLDRVRGGETVVLVTDAGTPGISDPGYPLVRAAIEARLPLTVLPGASAVLVALVASGMPVDRWRFVGFLPRGAGGIVAELDAPEPVVAFESPRRLRRTLATIAGHDPERRVAVCRELTKDHEEVVRGSAVEVAAHFDAHEPLGEIVLVIGAAPAAADTAGAVAALDALAAAGAKPRAAAGVVAGLLGLSKNAVYDRWLRERDG
jgi:16S rRNA (cytidine1402-2'-O)-methyltransferase